MPIDFRMLSVRSPACTRASLVPQSWSSFAIRSCAAGVCVTTSCPLNSRMLPTVPPASRHDSGFDRFRDHQLEPLDRIEVLLVLTGRSSAARVVAGGRALRGGVRRGGGAVVRGRAPWRRAMWRDARWRGRVGGEVEAARCRPTRRQWPHRRCECPASQHVVHVVQAGTTPSVVRSLRRAQDDHAAVARAATPARSTRRSPATASPTELDRRFRARPCAHRQVDRRDAW